MTLYVLSQQRDYAEISRKAYKPNTEIMHCSLWAVYLISCYFIWHVCMLLKYWILIIVPLATKQYMSHTSLWSTQYITVENAQEMHFYLYRMEGSTTFFDSFSFSMWSFMHGFPDVRVEKGHHVRTKSSVFSPFRVCLVPFPKILHLITSKRILLFRSTK